MTHPTPLQRRLLPILQAPDRLLPAHRPPTPFSLSLHTASGLLGALLFGAVLALGVGDMGGPSSDISLLLVPPSTLLLCFPPFYLLSALQGRPPGLLRLAGVAVSGMVVAGLWLGSSTPLLLLYLLSGEVDGAFFLLAFFLMAMGTLAGARAALKNARIAGAVAPGGLAVLAHYTFTLWTSAVLAIHLL